MYDLISDPAVTGELLDDEQDCSLGYRVCTNIDVQLVEIPTNPM